MVPTARPCQCRACEAGGCSTDRAVRRTAQAICEIVLAVEGRTSLMDAFRSREGHPGVRVVHRVVATAFAVLCTFACAVGLSAPAGAIASRTGVAFGAKDVTPHAPVSPHDVAPLSQAN